MQDFNLITKQVAEFYEFRAVRGQAENMRLSHCLIDFNALTADIDGIVNIRNTFDALSQRACETGNASLVRYVRAVGSMV